MRRGLIADCGLDKAAKVGEMVTFGQGIGRFYETRSHRCIAVRSLDVDFPIRITEVRFERAIKPIGRLKAAVWDRDLGV